MTSETTAITDEKIIEWTRQAATQLDSGWKSYDVQRQLAKEGCPPALLQQIMAAASSHKRAAGRRRGYQLMWAGALVILGALGAAHLNGGRPLGAFGLIGVVMFVRGAVKSFVG
jgi:hypothetical protein